MTPTRLAAAALGTAALLLGPLLLDHLRPMQRSLSDSYRALIRTNPEGRRRETYGELERIGYGYVSRILEGLPAADAMPIVRYPTWDHHLEFLLPRLRRERDPRILIGIGLTASDMSESKVATADRQAGGHNSAGADTSTWVFHTGVDAELMTGVVLYTSSGAGLPGVVKLTLRSSPDNPAILGQWTVTLEPTESGSMLGRLPEPLRPFSFTRGATDFILEIHDASGAPSRSIAAVSILGVKVDQTGYVIVNREGQCFTALQDTFLRQIKTTPGDPWLRWLDRVTNVRTE